jgi:glycosyltransferase XagB
VLARLLAGLGMIALALGLVLRQEDRAQRRRAVAVLAAANNPWLSRVQLSIDLLRRTHPSMVADTTLTLRQTQVLLAGLGILGFFLALSVHLTVMVLVALAIALYLLALGVRLHIFKLGLNDKGMIRIDDDTARAFPAEDLPTYTVLVPAYNEPQVFGQLVENLRALDYPRDKLELMLLLEADDEETIAAARAAVGDLTDFVIVRIPPAEPRTKPKALNYGLIKARGDLIAVYDAEDRPDVLQLRKAAIALARAPEDVACVQARLGFFNPQQNLLTKWFTLDYKMWFGELLPGLVQLEAPIPLGGTSNHFRKSALFEVGAWDAFNVTEDADLGLRLYRFGYRTGVIDSTTLEEANSDFVNWIKQRSRWYKGYAQTLLVHLRDPRAFRRDVGLRGMVLACLFVGGTPLLAVMNSFFWTCVIVWFIFHPPFFLQVLPTLTYFLGMISWIGGNATMLYCWLLGARRSDDKLILPALLSPLYWVMMALAATKAAIQLITAPSFWEKTQHGLDMPTSSSDAKAA